MKRFLSIDWDFFIDATSEERLYMFPDGGNENINTSLRDYIWDSRYRIPELINIGVIREHKTLLKICREFKGTSFIFDSHKYMYDYVMDNTEPDEVFEVYNIDFHHDLYHFKTSNERVNCGNWGTILREDRPNMVFKWIRRDDSDIDSIGGVPVDAEMMTFRMFNIFFRDGIAENFDYIYLCRSAMWSPPHLDKYFVQAVRLLKRKSSNSYFEVDIHKPRCYEIP